MEIGGYDILGLLGRGGMGRVYKARHPVLGRMAALKLCRPHEHLASLLGAAEIEQRFLREARIMARLGHPNIAEAWDAGTHLGAPFYVMEYFCNNLGAVMGEGYRLEAPSRRLPPRTALDYARQTLAGLGRLHHAGLVHRDVKPVNLMLTREDQVKIIDFGLSRLRNESGPGVPDNLKVGTPYYTAPEQERDPDRADHRADLFSVGVLVHRMLFGLLPRQVLDPDDADQPMDDPLPRLHPLLDDFFARALARDPDHRFASALDMAHALDELARALDRELENVCAAPPDHGRPASPGPAPRSAPVKVPAKRARQALGLDHLGAPGRYGADRFADNRDGTVSDPATGLTWQQAGSDYPLDWREAHEYVARLDEERFAGQTGWRLPTVEELCTLVGGPPSLRDYCADPVFDRQQRMLWSCDRKSFTAAWYLNAAMGFVDWQDMTCAFHVRGVKREDRGETL